MGRSESKQVVQQSTAQSAQDQANSQAALAKTNAATDSFNTNLNNFMRFGRKTYGTDGDYMKTQNTLGTTVAAGGAKGLEGDLALNAQRTGDNTSNYAAADAESRRQQQRDLTTFLAQANQNRLGQLTDIEKTGLDQSKFPAGVYGSLYGTGTGAANSAMGNAASAAKTPGFWDTFLPALAGAGGQVAGAYAGKKP